MRTILKHTRSLLSVAVIATLLFFVLFYIFSFVNDVIFRKIATQQAQQIQNIFEKEGKTLLKHAREVAKIEDVKDINRDNLSAILQEEMEKRDINILQVVDENGIVVFRANEPEKRGDDVFSTTAWGRRTREGEEVVIFGEDRNRLFALVATHPILEDDEVKGAVFAGYSFSDEFTRKFKEKYLPQNTEIVFYSSINGVAGSSFVGIEEKKLINTYINIGSDLLQGRKAHEQLLLGVTAYNVYNIELEGIDEEKGGGLVFMRVNNATQSIVIALMVAVSYAIIFYLVAIRRYKERFFRRHFLGSVLIFFAILMVTFFASQYAFYERVLKIDTTPFTIYNSTLSFNPGYDIYEVGKQQRVSIEIETGGEAINTAGVYVGYDPYLVRVDEVLIENSFCSQNLFIEKSIDNDEGQVRITCGLPSPGLLKDTRSYVADILITPLKEGYFSLSFTKETAVLANDGLGTNVLRFAENAGYQAVFIKQGFNFSTPPKILVFSSSHPNREIKYNKNEVEFSWADFPEYEYIYEFDQEADIIPNGQNFTADNNLSFTTTSDGVYYLHIGATKEGIVGPITHYLVNIDKTPPAPPVIRASSTNTKVGDVVRFEFSVDEKDDLQPNIYIKIDDSSFVPTTSLVFIPFFDAGGHRVTARIFDNAGNFSDSAIDINVRGTRFWDRFFFIDVSSWFR